MSAARALIDPCGRFLPALLVHDLRDRIRGHTRRANARWGRLDRPEARGRLVWIVSGAARTSVRLGVELARALLARRSDIDILLTYETQYADLIAPLARTPRVACGYGPADYIGAVQSVWRRLSPFGIIVAGAALRRNLLTLCEAIPHSLVVAPPVALRGRFERIYPAHGSGDCSGSPCAPQSDFDVLLNQPLEDAQCALSLLGSPERRLWWWHGDDAAAAKRLYALFRGHLPDDLLVVAGAACKALAAQAEGTLRLEDWEGTPVESDTLVLAGEPQWLQRLATRVSAIHFQVPEHDALYQSFAAGAVVSMAQDARLASATLNAAAIRVHDENDLIALWRRLAADASFAEDARHAIRHAHGIETRLATDNAADLIERVCRWR